MNVSGLNNLSFIPQAKLAKGNFAPVKGPSFFEDVLARSDRGVKSEGQEQNSGKEQKTDAKFSAPAGRLPQPKSWSAKIAEQNQPGTPSDNRESVNTTSVDGDGLPANPSAPSLNGPMLNDRLMSQPVAPQVVNPAGKQPMAVNPDGEVDSLTRRVVWNDFLRKMNEEFGISAEDVLQAFTSLSEEDLTKPPTETVDKVVMAMGLEGQQAQVAKQYFTELINKTQTRSMGEGLADSQKHISLTLMSQRELSRRNSNKAVDQMQQKFFMNGAYPRPQDAVAASPAGTKPYIPQAVVDEDGYVTYVNPQEQQINGQALTPVSSPIAGSGQAAPNSSGVDGSKTNEALASMQSVQNSGEKPSAEVDGLLKKFISGQAQSSQVTQAMAPLAAASSGGSAAPQASRSAVPGAQMMVNQFLGKESTATRDGGEEADYSSDASYLAGLNGETQNARAPGASEFQQQLSATGPAPQMAVPDLVQNAQVMVRDGGGEMTVTLTPDGLGEVAMKVTVQDGKVNVQMITESDEAKKLIERQLGELKSSLTSHHLQVTDIKVDTATNLGKQMEQQYNDGQRQLAQQTLEQFRQDHQGWRKSFFEVPGAKVYKGQSEAPRDVQAPGVSSKRAGSRRLDLVA